MFYNGTEKRPEYEEMRLSEAFCHKTDEPGIEVRCRVYNINPDNNRPLKERSAVLEDFFRDRKDEVKKMTHLDYTWERREQMIRKEEFEDGMEQGIAQGIQRGAEQEKLNTAVRMFKLQVPMEQIAQAVGESVETVERWLAEAEKAQILS